MKVRFRGDDEKAFRLPISRGKWRESFNGRTISKKKKDHKIERERER